MIFKAMLGSAFAENLFEIFGKDMLIECLLRVEDSVRVEVTELIEQYLPRYFASTEGHIDRVLAALTETLKLTDDIEGSVISAFNLINKIVKDPGFDGLSSKFRFQFEVFCPFNFHRVVLVRKTFNSLVTKFLSLPGFFSTEDLLVLHTLTVQSLIMEEDADLLKVLG